MRESNSVASVTQVLRQEAARLGPGSRLPSVRALMTRYRVSPGTVRLAVASLTNAGVLHARPGHGTFVTTPPAGPRSTQFDFSWQGMALGSARVSADDIASLLAIPAEGTINLAGGYPAVDLQAAGLVSQAMARATRRPGVWGRMPLEGLEALRQWFAQQLGSAFTAHEVLICPGSQAAITTAFNALAAPGDTVLMESPSYVGAIVAARAAGLRLVPIPTDRDGVRPDLLARAFDTTGARLFYVQPMHANPTGVVLAPDRRAQVLSAAVDAGAFIIEDDWCRDLSFDRSPARPLATEDANGHCVYVRSLTKSSAPGLRIGAIVARGAALARLGASRGIADFFVAGPLQEAALELVHTPAWMRHLRHLRSVLAQRRDVLAAAARRHIGENSLAVLPSGGMHLWVRLPDQVDDIMLAQRAAQSGVLVNPGRRWFPADATGSYVRLSYACAAEAALTRAAEVVGEIVHERVRVSGAAAAPTRRRRHASV